LSAGRISPGEVAVLAAGAIAIVLGAAAAHRSARGTPPVAAGSVAPAGLPPPLPSGAAPGSADELPEGDQGDSGCHFTDRGFGDYGRWRPLPLGKVLVPEGRAVGSDGSFRLLLHFHGAEPIRKELAPEGLDLVIAALDAGTGSHAYANALAAPSAYPALIESVEREVASASGLPAAHARPILISSWSAGSGAVTQILARSSDRVDALILLDSLYASYPSPSKRALSHGQLGPFVDAARAALQGGAPFYLTHTEVPTPEYASTEEVASFLLWELGVQADFAFPVAGDPIPLLRVFEEGHLVVRGYAGGGVEAHCSELRLLKGILREPAIPTRAGG
jgi:hypothetical protein